MIFLLPIQITAKLYNKNPYPKFIINKTITIAQLLLVRTTILITYIQLFQWNHNSPSSTTVTFTILISLCVDHNFLPSTRHMIKLPKSSFCCKSINAVIFSSIRSDNIGMRLFYLWLIRFKWKMGKLLICSNQVSKQHCSRHFTKLGILMKKMLSLSSSTYSSLSRRFMTSKSSSKDCVLITFSSATMHFSSSVILLYRQIYP